MWEEDGWVSVGGHHLAWCSGDLVVPRPIGASFGARRSIRGIMLSDRKGLIQNVRLERMLIKFGGVQPNRSVPAEGPSNSKATPVGYRRPTVLT
jgi:hypothetical protein